MTSSVACKLRVVEMTGVGIEYLSGIWSWTGENKKKCH